mmetsp:Transcript_78030/g.137664  ORF Transcript_78030/g.137664 Transcript_78030/m.137664 type:complete len:225 (+) Transcript_78030:486-1160(+)
MELRSATKVSFLLSWGVHRGAGGPTGRPYPPKTVRLASHPATRAAPHLLAGGWLLALHAAAADLLRKSPRALRDLRFPDCRQHHQHVVRLPVHEEVAQHPLRLPVCGAPLVVLGLHSRLRMAGGLRLDQSHEPRRPSGPLYVYADQMLHRTVRVQAAATCAVCDCEPAPCWCGGVELHYVPGAAQVSCETDAVHARSDLALQSIGEASHHHRQGTADSSPNKHC